MLDTKPQHQNSNKILSICSLFPTFPICYTSIMPEEVIKLIQYIVGRSKELKDKYTDEKDAPLEFVCVFCQSEEEYKKLDGEVKKNGRVAEETPSGNTYLLNESVPTVSGPLWFFKVRKFDPTMTRRGDADFNTNYSNFSQKYSGNPNFELVKRENFEMLRVSDPSFDVMACFSDKPKSKVLGIKLP